MSIAATRPILTLEQAQRILDAAEAGARERSQAFSFAVVDDGGALFAFRRMDGIHIGTVDVSIAKARAAASFRRPTRRFAQGVAEGNLALLSLPGLVALDGGVPLLIEGAAVGAIGVSGASPQEDDAIAEIGAAALGGDAP